MLGGTGRVGTALASVSLLGAVILGASASGGTGPATATTTAPDVRAQAQQILKSRASLLSAPVLTAMEMIARGDHSLSPSAATAPDAVQRHRSALKAAVQSTAAFLTTVASCDSHEHATLCARTATNSSAAAVFTSVRETV